MKRNMFQSIVLLFLFAGVSYAANGDLIVNGNLGVGTSTPSQKLSVAGTIQSTSGGIMFPDGTTQTSAATQFPAGVVAMYGGSTAPAGWLLCDGSAVSRTTNAALFAAINVAYGAGDGVTTFNLPDFRGVFPKGAGITTRTDALTAKDASGNAYAGVLGQYKGDQMQGHNHYIRRRGAGTSYSTNNANGATVAAANNEGLKAQDGVDNLHTGLLAASMTNDPLNGAPRIAHTTEPQSVGINFIIKK